MAYYAALVSLMQLLEDIVHRDRHQNLLLDKKQIASVYEKFSGLQALLDDYSLKDREKADVLERQIRDAAYQAQDIIESHISNQVHPNDETDEVLGLDNQGLERVKEQVDSIVEELLTIHTSQIIEDLLLDYYPTDAGTSKQAPSRTDPIEGHEDHLMTIKDQLYGGPSRLQVVSIVGMGGVGKTTLARNIFYDKLMLDRFGCRAWATISQDYHPKKVFLDILYSLNVPSDKSNGIERLRNEIYEHLRGWRYLIILDDIWDTKVWDDIKRILPDDSNGSRIMITTRIPKVASCASTFGFSYQMQTLNEDQNWKLFHKMVSCPLYLEDIGRLIAKSCCGLPLAVAVVAGLLSKVNRKRSDWEEFARNVSSAIENDPHFSNMLSLSYNNLSHHLKPLFLYIGGFPEDCEIPVSKLVKLWIAEGILKPIESKSLEEVAIEYLEDLINRSLVVATKKTLSGKIKCCRIHDVFRYFCRKILHVPHKDSCISPTAAGNVCRIYIHPAQSTFKAEECGSLVRSIISLSNDCNFSSFGRGFRQLRVLDAAETILFAFPIEILELFHLRYLALCDDVIPIPPSISNLQNLQTLILSSRDTYKESFSLPSQIWEMPNLRYIVVWLLELSSLSKERVRGKPCILENLQTLSCVANLGLTNEVIEMIPNLKKLKVFYDETNNVWQKFHLNNLFYLCHLETLNILFPTEYRRIMHPLPENFAFPSTLKKLSLRHCRIPWKDMTVVGSLPNLQVLKLRDDAVIGEMWEPIEGEFPELRFLLMEKLEIKYWKLDYTHFPTLHCLKISRCRNLHEIPDEIGDILTLELVEVHYSSLAAVSALKMQQEQQELGNYFLQVRIYPQSRNFRLLHFAYAFHCY